MHVLLHITFKKSHEIAIKTDSDNQTVNLQEQLLPGKLCPNFIKSFCLKLNYN